MVDYKSLKSGDILITKRNLLGVYGFTCHPSSDYEDLKNNIFTIDPDNICIYTGQYWSGNWKWSSEHRVDKFVFLIHNAKVCWVCLEWLQIYK